MTADIEERDLGSAAETRRTPSLVERLRNRGRAFAVPVFTSLTRRIVILNLAALVVLVSGILSIPKICSTCRSGRAHPRRLANSASLILPSIRNGLLPSCGGSSCRPERAPASTNPTAR
ncbi:MAG: sensor N-terminal transmembrane domain-containing protein [Alphaproteobacteria bacterium]